ncbi:AsmA family protein [Dethiosulfatarculus sandiegensis]|uniref:AsmA domain-containing protein n=1 Tax=Dethiosulfatarculus sandiegensis TaxID=1429043 RepID=A0A0D2JA69_9BACT|nr:AsmA family protein [Dethiosulfatarculus sandiegensis]KIX15019.1 hypothetical protein X474_05550 [Dethiosulfatarculus sandiegensis]
MQKRLLIKTIKWVLGIFLYVLAGSVLILLCLICFQVELDLSAHKNFLAQTLSRHLAHDLRLSGPVFLRLAPISQLKAQHVALTVKPGITSGLERASLAKLELAWDLFPLLRGEISFQKLFLDQAELDITPLQRSNTSPGKPVPSQTNPKRGFFNLTQIKEIKINRLTLKTRSPRKDTPVKLVIKTLDGAIPENQPGWLDLKGEYEREAFSLGLKVGPPALQSKETTYLPFSLFYKARDGQLTASGKLWEKPMIRLELELAFQNLDLAGIFRKLNLGQRLKAKVRQVDLKAMVKGSSLTEIAAQSSLEMIFKRVDIEFQEPAQKSVIAFESPDGRLSIQPGKPVSLILTGKINRQPVLLAAETATFPELLSLKTAPSLNVKLSAKGNTLKLKKQKPGPFKGVKVALKGRDLKSLEELTQKRLPAIGPYHLSGLLKTTPKGYAIDNLQARLAQSRLQGNFALSLADAKPSLKINLSSEYIQLRDLAGLKHGQELPKAKPDKKQISTKPWFIFSPEFMEALDFEVRLKASKVQAGQETWGGGLLNLSLQNKKLVLNPLHLELPGGLVKIRGHFARQNKAAMGLFIDIERLDYGTIARMIAPEKDYQGIITLKAKLNSQAKEPHNLLKNAHGKFDFAVWPTGVETDAIDLWAVNLLSAVLNQFKKNKARLNCLVCRLKVQNGKATQEDIILDTSQMRVRGQAEMDFNTGKIWLRLEPAAKKPQFFSLATPIEVKGSFKDFKAGIPTGAILSTATKLITDMAVVPLQMLFQKTVPLDGNDVCTDPLK